MGEYESSIDVAAPADKLFAYLAEVQHLPQYFSQMKSAEPAGGDEVDVIAEEGGTEHEAEAWVRQDEQRRQLRWGAEGSSSYQGELDVTGDEHESTVTVRLHTEHGDAKEIDAGLAETLQNVKRLVERGPAPGPSGSA